MSYRNPFSISPEAARPSRAERWASLAAWWRTTLLVPVLGTALAANVTCVWVGMLLAYAEGTAPVRALLLALALGSTITVMPGVLIISFWHEARAKRR